MNGNDEENQPAAANVMSYVDRIVHEVEKNDEEDASSSNMAHGDEGGDGQEEGGANSNLSVEDDYEPEPSDDEMTLEYDYDEMEDDSDEDTDLMEENNYEPASSGGDLNEESKALFYWRLDKSESLSDHTIEVSVTDGINSKTSYHVHMIALAVGPKKSEYFETLFKSGQSSESVNSTSAVELPEDIAAGVPSFLDYMYSHPSECTRLVSRENRRSLQYLAHHLRVPKLTDAIHKFVEEDMHNLVHMEGYLSEFGGAEDEESRTLLSIAARVCTKMILHIELGSSLHTALPPGMFLHMISKVPSTLPPSKKHHIRRLALGYIKHHHASFDERFFDVLTSGYYFRMPLFPEETDLAGETAIDLLEIMKLTGWKFYAKMKDFCIAVLHRYLAKTEPTLSKITNITQKLPEDVLPILLTGALAMQGTANVEYKDVSCKIMTRWFVGADLDSIVKISVNSTDSIYCILYLLLRRLNIGMRRKVDVYCEGNKLEREQIVSNCGITSNSVLEIRESAEE